MPEKLAGKVAVITGGSSGIGLATAKRFVDEGAYVFITGRRENELDAAVKEIGRNVTGIRGDVSKLADIDKVYARSKTRKRSSTSSSPMLVPANSLRLARLQRSISTSSLT